MTVGIAVFFCGILLGVVASAYVYDSITEAFDYAVLFVMFLAAGCLIVVLSALMEFGGRRSSDAPPPTREIVIVTPTPLPEIVVATSTPQPQLVIVTATPTDE